MEGKLQARVLIIGIIAFVIVPEIGVTLLILLAAWWLLCKALSSPE